MILALLIFAAMAVTACSAVTLPSSGSISQPARRAENAASRQPCREPGGWQCIAVTDLTTAADYLDHLDEYGIEERELAPIGDGRFLIYWRSPTE